MEDLLPDVVAMANVADGDADFLEAAAKGAKDRRAEGQPNHTVGDHDRTFSLCILFFSLSASVSLTLYVDRFNFTRRPLVLRLHRGGEARRLFFSVQPAAWEGI